MPKPEEILAYPEIGCAAGPVDILSKILWRLACIESMAMEIFLTLTSNSSILVVYLQDSLLQED